MAIVYEYFITIKVRRGKNGNVCINIDRTCVNKAHTRSCCTYLIIASIPYIVVDSEYDERKKGKRNFVCHLSKTETTMRDNTVFFFFCYRFPLDHNRSLSVQSLIFFLVIKSTLIKIIKLHLLLSLCAHWSAMILEVIRSSTLSTIIISN